MLTLKLNLYILLMEFGSVVFTLVSGHYLFDTLGVDINSTSVIYKYDYVIASSLTQMFLRECWMFMAVKHCQLAGANIFIVCK